MKTKAALLFVLVTAISAAAAAQTVGITPRKVTYKRIKPIADYKKTFTVTYPRVKAATPALSRRIEAILGYEKLFDFKLADELRDTQWLEDASYDVDYNANKVLSISLTIAGSGAYPSGSTKYVVVNTAAGTRVRSTDVFVNTSRLLAIIVKMKDAEVKKAIADIKADPETKDDDVSTLFADSAEYNKVKLDEFSIKENGVLFHHNYGFPHVALALEPAGEFFLTWKDLKPFIKPGSLLAQFVR